MTGITRRRLLAFGASAVAIAAVQPLPAFAQQGHEHMNHGADEAASEIFKRQPLPLPELLEPDATGLVRLKVAKGQHSFQEGTKAASAGVNGAYLGPVVRLKNDQTVTLQVVNAMDEPTTLHWHGLFVPSVLDGGPHNVINAGETWAPKINVNQPASFNWFHPHMHGDTARQTHMGIAGLMIVSDGKDTQRGLPETYGVDDLPLVLQDRRVIDGDHVYAPDIMDLMHGFYGDKLIVNGAIAPDAKVPASVVRLRLLNGANARNFHVRFSDDRPFWVVASDGGYIQEPEALNRLTLSPGERYEVLVDFARGAENIELLTFADDRGNSELPLMQFHVDKTLTGAIKTVPTFLDGPEAADPKQAIRKRSFFFDERMAENMQMMMQKSAADPHAGHDMGTMDMSSMAGGMMDHDMHGARSAENTGPALNALTSGLQMAMAGEPFDMGRIDVEAKLGSWEIWELTTKEMAHPFHIHGASFRILSLNGKAPPAHQAGWKDTALINGKAELLIHFDRKAERSHPFMFHCHLLEHEDIGMMAQFITV